MCRHNYDASQDGIIILKRLGTINKNKTVERTIFERFRRRRREKIVFFNDQIMIFSGKMAFQKLQVYKAVSSFSFGLPACLAGGPTMQFRT